MTLPLAGAVRELEVALEHLWDAVHAPVAQGAAAREHRQTGRSVAVDAAVLDEAMSLTDRAETEDLEPEVDERREAVVELGQVDLAGPTPRPPTGGRPVSPPAS